MEEIREYIQSFLRRISHIEKRLEEMQQEIDSLYQELTDKGEIE